MPPILKYLILPVDLLVERAMLGLLSIPEFLGRQSARRRSQLRLMRSFERLLFSSLPRLKFAMRSLVTAELIEGHRRSRWIHDCLGPNWSQHFDGFHNATLQFLIIAEIN